MESFIEKLNFIEKTIDLLKGDYEESSVKMKSSNYKERFLAEKAQLEMRYWKLKRMLLLWDQGQLDFVPSCPRELYDLQIEGMEKYLNVLNERKKLEFKEE